MSSRLLQLPTPTPTRPPVDYEDLVLRATPSPSTCDPTRVVVVLSTTLVIPDYYKYYSGLVDEFKPTWTALDDASLLAPPFYKDLTNSSISLLVSSMLLVIFIRSTFVSGMYLRTALVKKKRLFYLLFASQLLALVGIFPMVVSQFTRRINCTAVVLLFVISGSFSLSLLITGIMGYKAYRCLNDSRFVLAVITLLQIATFVLLGLLIPSLHGEHRLSGSCTISTLSLTLQYGRFIVVLQPVSSLFICCCFFYGVWSSRGSSDERGRISIRMSMDVSTRQFPRAVENRQLSRGWWDYVPNASGESTFVSEPKPSFLAWLKTRLPAFLGGHLTDRPPRKPSLPGPVPLRQPAPPSFVRLPSPSPSEEPKPEDSDDFGEAARPTALSSSRTSAVPSSFSRISRFIPQMELFRSVMRDELWYTTGVTVVYAIIVIVVVVSVSLKDDTMAMVWMSINWAVVSLLSMHSFSRVVKRHEREAFMATPAPWQQSTPPNDTARPRRVLRSTASSIPYRRSYRGSNVTEADNPFSDEHSTRVRRGPVGSERPERLADQETSGASVKFTIHTESSSNYSFSRHTSFRTIKRTLSASRPPTLPPQLFNDFPSSGRGTPVVPQDSNSGTFLPELSNSWYERSSMTSSLGQSVRASAGHSNGDTRSHIDTKSMSIRFDERSVS